jgi:hypothetical protein
MHYLHFCYRFSLLALTIPLLVLEGRPAAATPESCAQIWVYENDYVQESENVTKRIGPKIYKLVGDGYLDDEASNSLKKASRILSKAQWTSASCLLFLNMNNFPPCYQEGIISAFSVMGHIRRKMLDPIAAIMKQKDENEKSAMIRRLHAGWEQFFYEHQRLSERSDQLVRSCRRS